MGDIGKIKPIQIPTMLLDQNKKSIILELGFPEIALPKLEAFMGFIWESNQTLNLFSRKMSFNDLIDNHLIDCLLPLKHFPKGINSVGDFGSGGGFPGILYSIIFPNIKFHLYEKSSKKREFLSQCFKIINNFEVHGEITPNLPQLDLVISRAFKPLDLIIEISQNYYLNSGRYFLLKGRKEKIDEEIKMAIKKFKDCKINLIPLTSPVLDVERHLVLI